MGYNRYRGNSGMIEYVETPSESASSPAPPIQRRRPEPPLSGFPAGLGDVFSRAFLSDLETEDWLVAAILYLAYRSSGDIEMLIALGAYLLL